MAIGKFHGVMMPTTPTGSRVTSTSRPGRVEATFSPARRRHSPEKNRNTWAARTVSPMPSARVLPSSRESRRPISSLRAMSSSPTRLRMSWRVWMPERDQAGNAALAAAIAAPVCAASACAKRPTTSPVLDGLTSSTTPGASSQAPPT